MQVFKQLQVCLMLFPLICFGQGIPGAAGSSLSGSDLAQSGDQFKIFSCSAALSGIEETELGAFYSPSPFGMTEMATHAGAFLCPLKPFNLAAAYSSYGFDLYRERSFYICLAKKFEGKLGLGLAAVFRQISIKNYSSAHAICLNFSVLYPLFDGLNCAFLIENLTNSSYGNTEDQIPRKISTGLMFSPFNGISLMAELEKEGFFPLSPALGIEYSIMNLIFLRAGTRSSPDSYSMGLGLAYKFIEMDFSFQSYGQLGSTKEGSITFKF